MSEIIDEFRADTEQLRRCIKALIEMSDEGVMIPNRLGGHARNLLAAAYHRLGSDNTIGEQRQKEEVLFRTKDHPLANGRQPQYGDQIYQQRFPIEDGRELVIEMGRKGFDATTDLLFDMLTNAPSHGDGTTNVG